MQEAIRLFLQREAATGEGLKPLSYWERWFPPDYDHSMMPEEYDEVQGANCRR